MDEFIKKDLFDLHIQRMETLMALNLTEQKAMNERLEGRIDVLSERIDKNLAQYEVIASDIEGEIQALNARVGSLEDKISLNVTVTGVLVGAFGIIITIVIAIIQLWK